MICRQILGGERMKTINDRLAQGLLFGVIPALWILDGAGIINLKDVILGGIIVSWSLMIQFYFRKVLDAKKSST